MIYLKLLFAFLKVGCFAFGGGYGAIPLIRDVVVANGWMDDEALAYMIAVSESTPGPIMANLATYAGAVQAGFAGALAATAAVVLPAFVITILITELLKNLLKKPWMQAVLTGMRAAVTGIILATGVTLLGENCLPAGSSPDRRAPILGVLLLAAAFLLPRFRKRKLSATGLILLSAIGGILIYGI